MGMQIFSQASITSSPLKPQTQFGSTRKVTGLSGKEKKSDDVVALFLSMSIRISSCYNDIIVLSVRCTVKKFIEIRSYTLKPGTGDEFHRLFLEEALPLIKH